MSLGVGGDKGEEDYLTLTLLSTKWKTKVPSTVEMTHSGNA